MDYKVIQRFKDRYTGESYPIGKVLTLSDKRAAEILAVGGLIAPIEIPVEVAEEEPKPKKGRKKAEK